MRSLKALAFAFCFMMFALLQLSGCGGKTSGGGTTTPTNPTVSTVTLSVSPASVQVGATAQATCVVKMSDGTTDTTGCTFASDATTIASVDANGLVTAKAAGTANITATAKKDGSTTSPKFVVTVTAIPVTITSVSVTANPASIASDATSTCTATVTGTGAFSSAVAWTAIGGTIVAGSNNTATFTPTATGTGTCTATSTQTGYTTVSGSASITVTRAVPVITAISAPAVALDSPGIVGLAVTGKNFTSTDTIKVTAPGSFLTATMKSSMEIDVSLDFTTHFYSPGWYGFTVCEADKTTCSNTSNFAFIGNQNTLAVGPDGELYQNDQAQGNATGYNAYLRKFKVTNGVATADGSLQTSFMKSTAIDPKTGYDVAQIGTFDLSGSTVNEVSLAADDGNGSTWVGQDANNGLSCFSRPYGNPTANLLSCFAVGVNNAPLASVTLGTEPWTVAMATLSSTTYAFVYSRKTTPMLWKVDAKTANPVGSYAPLGFTDNATIATLSILSGWEVVAFEKGSLTGTVALLSNYDKSVIFVNATTMAQIGQPIELTGNPFRIAKDETNGKLIVAFADLTDPAKPKTTFASVSPSATTPVVLGSSSSNLAVGFAVSPDGNYLYACQRASCDVQPNK